MKKATATGPKTSVLAAARVASSMRAAVSLSLSFPPGEPDVCGCESPQRERQANAGSE